MQQPNSQGLSACCGGAALSEKVASEPVGVQILGEQVVLFRDKQGQVHCLGDVCPHRGAPLHRGWVAEADGQDCIVCPYHGWVSAY